MIYNLTTPPLPGHVTPLEAFAVIKCLDENGDVVLFTRSTDLRSGTAWGFSLSRSIASAKTRRKRSDSTTRKRTTMSELKIGLRFDRRDARALTQLADRAKRRELKESHVVFAHAADAARTGEPWIIVCSQPVEAILIAQAMPRYGIRPPALEQLS